MMRKIIVLFIFLTVSYGYGQCTSGSTGAAPGETDFVLVWADEFSVDGPPCSDNWDYDIGGWGWGNNEAQYYTNSTNNANVQSGILTIKAIKENFGGNEYTSARLLTKDVYEFTYGKIEIRAKLPTENGTWSALWMLGANFPETPWPACGEIDIMEHTGNNENVVLGTTHNTAGSGGGGVGSSTSMPTPTEFHKYSIIWDYRQIEFFVDDVLFFTYNPNPTNNNNYPYKSDFFLIMNIAMGGTLGGAIDPGFTDASMEIDYVRVYQSETSLEPPPAPDPVVSAPTPTIDESNVISVFNTGNPYTDISPVDYDPNWGQATIATQVLINGNNTLKYENLNYQGTDFSSIQQDLTGMTYVHLDYWATTSTEFSFFLIDQTAGFSGGEPEEPRYKIAITGGDETLVSGEWKSVFIPLQHFLDFDSGAFPYDLNDIGELKVEGNGTLFLDNIYFSTENGLGTSDFEITDFKVFPNPTQDFWTLKAVNQDILSIKLFNILGKNVLSLSPNSEEIKIDGSGLTTGLYFARIKTTKGISSIKLIKK